MVHSHAQRYCLTYCGCTFWRDDECHACCGAVWRAVKLLALTAAIPLILAGTGRAVLEIPTLYPVNATIGGWIGASALAGVVTWALAAYAVCLVLCVRDVWRASSARPQGVRWLRWCTMRENPDCLAHPITNDDTSPAALATGYWMLRMQVPSWAVRSTLIVAVGVPLGVGIVASGLFLVQGLIRLLTPPIGVWGLVTTRALRLDDATCTNHSAHGVAAACWHTPSGCPCGAVGMLSLITITTLVWVLVVFGQCVIQRARRPADVPVGEAQPLLPVRGLDEQ